MLPETERGLLPRPGRTGEKSPVRYPLQDARWSKRASGELKLLPFANRNVKLTLGSVRK